MALERILDVRLPEQGVPDLSGQSIERIAATSPEKVIDMVRDGGVDYGCVPIESSVEGSVPSTMDALSRSDRVQIVAECVLGVTFTIAAARPMLPRDVATIAAYPVASRQVRHSVAECFPNARFVPAESNSAAARDAASGTADAAVTTSLATGMYELTALAERVADSGHAATRFVLVGRPGPIPPRSSHDRTSVVLDLPNAPGSLMAAMNQFSSRGIDLTRIESRPQRMPGRYYFFLDAVGHLDDPAIAEALAGLHRCANQVIYLGSWPTDGPTGSPPPDHAESLAWVASLRSATQ